MSPRVDDMQSRLSLPLSVSQTVQGLVLAGVSLGPSLRILPATVTENDSSFCSGAFHLGSNQWKILFASPLHKPIMLPLQQRGKVCGDNCLAWGARCLPPSGFGRQSRHCSIDFGPALPQASIGSLKGSKHCSEPANSKFLMLRPANSLCVGAWSKETYLILTC